MEHKSEVVILMATYNGAEYLREQLDSIVHQDFTDWTLLVSDDGSFDFTPQILEEYAQRFPERIFLLKKDTPGGSAKKNFLLLTANAEQAGGFSYVMYSDQDDCWDPGKIRLTLRKMRETEAGHPETHCLVHTDLRVADERLAILAPSFFQYSGIRPERDQLPMLLVQNVVTGCTMMLNRSLWQLAVRQADPEKIQMHDWWFALLAAAAGKIGLEPHATIAYRQHGSNSVGAQTGHGTQMVVSGMKKGGANRRQLTDSMVQAGLLLKTIPDCLTKPQKELLRAYADGAEKGKWYRVKTSLRYGIWKSSFIKRIAQVLYD